MASDSVISETVSKAVDALLKWRRSQSETQKPKLYDEDEEFVYLVLTLKKIPSTSRVNPHKIPLPHPLLSPFSEQCLILDDRPNKARVTKAQAQSKIESESIPINKVLKLSKLASDYRPFEAKRKLCDSYDLFFAEKSIVPLLPRLLGKSFFKKRKIPVPVDLKKGNWKEQVERACSSAMLFLRTGTCSVVRVAKVRMERDEIVENVMAAIQGAVEVVPKKWGNVRSLHLKLLESLALPVYQTVPDLKLKIDGTRAEDETPEKTKKRKEKDGEVSDSVEGGEMKKKKGRIHEVRYMDENVPGDEVENELASGDDGDNGSDSEDEMVNKKRKKRISSELSDVEQLKKLVFNELSAKGKKKKKGLSVAKADKEGLVGGSGSELVVKDEESGVKKKKKKRGDVNVKAMKGVKASKGVKATKDVEASKGVKATKGVKAKKTKKAV